MLTINSTELETVILDNARPYSTQISRYPYPCGLCF